MEFSQLKYKSSLIGFCRFGQGPQTALCFHGYGEDGSAFRFLEKQAGDQFTFYAIDLPWHGHTDWKEGMIFTPDDLIAVINELVQGKTKLTLIGFSLGGRVALSLFQLIPERVEKIVLLAPDGLKVNFWYWLATQTKGGNRFFAFTMKHPGWFFGFLKLLNKLRLVNASIFKFVNYYIGSPAIRQQLYARWTTLRKCRTDRKLLATLINKQSTPVRLVYGKHDRIILASVGEKFRKKIAAHCRLEVIPSGHQVLHEKHAEYILQNLNS